MGSGVCSIARKASRASLVRFALALMESRFLRTLQGTAHPRDVLHVHAENAGNVRVLPMLLGQHLHQHPARVQLLRGAALLVDHP